MFSCRQRILSNITSKVRLTSSTRFFSTLERNVDYVPVINIPENELAFNAFFSLHRPLLGLSEQNNGGFFEVKPTPEETLNTKIYDYLMQQEAFVPPSSKSNTSSIEQDDINGFYVYENNDHLFQISATSDVLDYLTSVQYKLNEKYAMLEDEQTQIKSQKEEKSIQLKGFQ